MKELKDISNFYDFTIAQELRIESLIKDIAIGFAKYYRNNGGNDRIVIVDSQVYTEFRTNDELFNEYLNTLK